MELRISALPALVRIPRSGALFRVAASGHEEMGVLAAGGRVRGLTGHGQGQTQACSGALRVGGQAALRAASTPLRRPSAGVTTRSECSRRGGVRAFTERRSGALAAAGSAAAAFGAFPERRSGALAAGSAAAAF